MPRCFGDDFAQAAAPVILAAAGLAHDLGNPPFGHQGETAIRDWFAKNPEVFESSSPVPDDIRHDFYNFEGNAQTLRLLSRLQVSLGGFGLDLTAATLAALMKYTVPSWRASKTSNPSSKKPGFFACEEPVVQWIRQETGLVEGQRHPLTWLMEACDDIAYSILDIEDSIKKGIMSAEDVLAHLRRRSTTEKVFAAISERLDADFNAAQKVSRRSRIGEIKTSYLRTRLIEVLITGAADGFISEHDSIFNYRATKPLLESGTSASAICNELKTFARANSFNHPSVLRVEHEGAVAISKLMDWFWNAIVERQDPLDPDSRRKGAFNCYVYELISPNYRDEFLDAAQEGTRLPMRYWELRLLTDMISGMTDRFAMDTFLELDRLHRA